MTGKALFGELPIRLGKAEKQQKTKKEIKMNTIYSAVRRNGAASIISIATIMTIVVVRNAQGASSIPNFTNQFSHRLSNYSLTSVFNDVFQYGWERTETKEVRFEFAAVGLSSERTDFHGWNWTAVGYPAAWIGEYYENPPGSGSWYFHSRNFNPNTPWSSPTQTSQPSPYTKLEFGGYTNYYAFYASSSIYELFTTGTDLTYLYKVRMNVTDRSNGSALGWSIASMANDSNGDVYLVVSDQYSMDITPTANSGWYGYTDPVIGKVSFSLSFRNSGYLTSVPNSQGVGYDKHDVAVGIIGSNILGSLPQLTSLGLISNAQETKGIVPAVAVLRARQYFLNRDVSSRSYLYNPADQSLTALASIDWSQSSPPGGGNDNAANVIDGSPDTQGQVFTCDAPGFAVSSPALEQAPQGSVVAMRFNAREWAALESATGAIVSPLLEWHSQITVKKGASGWYRVGPKNQITTGHVSTDFDSAEAASY